MRLVCLPPYSPELNQVEHVWDELREKAFGNVVFNSLDALEEHLEASLAAMEQDTVKSSFHRCLALDYKRSIDLESELSA